MKCLIGEQAQDGLGRLRAEGAGLCLMLEPSLWAHLFPDARPLLQAWMTEEVGTAPAFVS